MILIDLAAYAHDTKAHMEEMLTMNSYYHPHEHDQGDEAHPDHAEHHSDTSIAREQHHASLSHYEEHPAATGHEAEEVAQEPNESQWMPDAQHPDSDRDLYQVLLAVERGELSAEDAARKLEELEGAALPDERQGLI